MWQRWNSTTKIFEKSNDNGGSWSPLGLDGAIITQGTVADARLSNNIPLKNGANAFTGANSFANTVVDLLVGQLKFPAAANPSANVNTLDDYEEGSWTPIDSSGAGIVFGFAAGTYTKIGNRVYVTGQINYPVSASGANALIGGLPFACSPNAGLALGGSVFIPAVVAVIGGSTTFRLENMTTGAILTNTNMSGRIVIVSGNYNT